ncbi:MAG TPA: hypothetical protein VFG59_01310, partial [Anaeromyxobacter sp.]|nr:hypothetical protein [Anaeromyxobacter sp.]
MWRGLFDPTTDYGADDVVSLDGSSYVATESLTGVIPPATGWSLVASIGATGQQGPKGVDGVDGQQGPQGLQGPTGPEGATGPRGLQGVQGATGPTGLQGLQGIQGVAGPPGINWLGSWNARTSYYPNDAVEYGGASYIATVNNYNYPPPQEGWDLLADKGGVGPAGPQGIQGVAGPQGIQGQTGAAGPAGATGPAGPVGLTWRGTWSNSVAYSARDGVQYNGSAYVATQPASGAGQ